MSITLEDEFTRPGESSHYIIADHENTGRGTRMEEGGKADSAGGISKKREGKSEKGVDTRAG